MRAPKIAIDALHAANTGDLLWRGLLRRFRHKATSVEAIHRILAPRRRGKSWRKLPGTVLEVKTIPDSSHKRGTLLDCGWLRTCKIHQPRQWHPGTASWILIASIHHQFSGTDKAIAAAHPEVNIQQARQSSGPAIQFAVPRCLNIYPLRAETPQKAGNVLIIRPTVMSFRLLVYPRKRL